MKVTFNSETLWTVACQAPLSMVFFRQEHWSVQLFLYSGDFPKPGIKLVLSALPADSLQQSLYNEINVNFNKLNAIRKHQMKLNIIYAKITYNIKLCYSINLQSVMTIDQCTYMTCTSEKIMATHSSVLAWKIPQPGEPGGLHLWGHRVGHD